MHWTEVKVFFTMLFFFFVILTFVEDLFFLHSKKVLPKRKLKKTSTIKIFFSWCLTKKTKKTLNTEVATKNNVNSKVFFFGKIIKQKHVLPKCNTIFLNLFAEDWLRNTKEEVLNLSKFQNEKKKLHLKEHFLPRYRACKIKSNGFWCFDFWHSSWF